mmetsp:Transcript_24317/g.40730  ORF Transcript_24317/g.40730 Transcript_24317/m.40730 type:complete len:362 (+) Transcript_24317:110-1195(+)
MQHTLTASAQIVSAKQQPNCAIRRHFIGTNAAPPRPALAAVSSSLRASAFVPSGASLRAVPFKAMTRTHSTTARRPLKVSALTVKEEIVIIQTPTGPMHTLVLSPTAPGRYPAILLYSEIFQVTGPIRRSAQIMACHGFVVAVPDIYHEQEAPGSCMLYDGPGAERGNFLKISKPMHAFDSDAHAAIQHLKSHSQSTGKVGTMGFCVGGHLAYRAALHPDVRSASCWYPTDIHKGSPDSTIKRPARNGGSMGTTCDTCHRTPEFAAKGTELLMIFGRQDPHIDVWGRKRIRNALADSNVHFSWHEFNGQHAFMRDEGYRYDAELALQCYQMAINLFRRTLHEGDLPVPSGQQDDGNVESKH